MKFIYISLLIFLLPINMFAQWFIQHPHFSNVNLESIRFVDTLNGWACGLDGIIMHTTDWGISWTYQVAPTSHHIFSVNIGTFQHIRAVGNAGTILLSTDLGEQRDLKQLEPKKYQELLN